MNNPLGLVLKLFCICIIKLLRLIVNMFFFLLPVGLYVVIIQLANKMNAFSSLHSYVEPDKAEWMFIYPNTILVTTDSKLYKRNWKEFERKFNKFINEHKYVLITLVCLVIVLIGMFK